jgi:hypothetical protein
MVKGNSPSGIGGIEVDIAASVGAFINTSALKIDIA